MHMLCFYTQGGAFISLTPAFCLLLLLLHRLIAATYTPMVAVPLVHDPIVARKLLVRVWMTALSGAAKTWLWPNSPRFLSALTYVAMGWSALPYLPMLTAAVDSHVVMLVSLVCCQRCWATTAAACVLHLAQTHQHLNKQPACLRMKTRTPAHALSNPLAPGLLTAACMPACLCGRCPAGCCWRRAVHAGCDRVRAALPRPLATQLWLPRGVPHPGGRGQRVPLCRLLPRARQGRQQRDGGGALSRPGRRGGAGSLHRRPVLAADGHHRLLRREGGEAGVCASQR